MTNPNNLSVGKARTIFDFFYIRRLRNLNYKLLTGKPTYVGVITQLQFYFFLPRNVSIYIALLGSKRVGYLLLRKEGEFSYITEVVERSYRGRKIGSELIKYAKSQERYLIANILEDNIASIMLHKENGFKFIRAENNYLVFEWKI